MLASVVIPTCGRPDLLRQTLRSVLDVDFDPAAFEVVIVDNEPGGDHVQTIVDALAASAHAVRHVREPKRGLHHARNSGAAAAHSELLAYLDDDVLVDRLWLGEIVAGFADPAVACVGGPIVPLWVTGEPAWRRFFTPAVWSLLDHGPEARLLDAGEEIYGANFAVRRVAVIDEGGFPPDSVGPDVGDGETGLLRRIRSRGWQVAYRPGARVHHVLSASRVTEQYVYERLRTQGGCDCYTAIRASRPARATLLGSAAWGAVKAAHHRLARLRLSYRRQRPRAYYDHLASEAYHRGASAYRLKTAFDAEHRALVQRNQWYGS